MSDVGEAFGAMKEESRAKRERNRKMSLYILRENGVNVEIKNDGAHLIITTTKGKIDFWPGTGKYISRGKNVTGRGVYNLMSMIGRMER